MVIHTSTLGNFPLGTIRLSKGVDRTRQTEVSLPADRVAYVSNLYAVGDRLVRMWVIFSVVLR